MDGFSLAVSQGHTVGRDSSGLKDCSFGWREMYIEMVKRKDHLRSLELCLVNVSRLFRRRDLQKRTRLPLSGSIFVKSMVYSF